MKEGEGERKIIGICGFKRHGKSTSATFFESKGYVKRSMVKPMRDMLAAGFDLDRELLEGESPEAEKWKEEPLEFWSSHLCKSETYNKSFPYMRGVVTPRTLMQFYGKDIHRDMILDEFWVVLMKKFLDENPEVNVVIPDVRGIKEVEMLQKYNTTFLWIQSPPLPEYANHEFHLIPVLFPEVHETEWAWLKYKELYTPILNERKGLDHSEEKEKSLNEL
jgi:hypothetical protein